MRGQPRSLSVQICLSKGACQIIKQSCRIKNWSRFLESLDTLLHDLGRWAISGSADSSVAHDIVTAQTVSLRREGKIWYGRWVWGGWYGPWPPCCPLPGRPCAPPSFSTSSCSHRISTWSHEDQSYLHLRGRAATTEEATNLHWNPSALPFQFYT